MESFKEIEDLIPVVNDARFQKAVAQLAELFKVSRIKDYYNPITIWNIQISLLEILKGIQNERKILKTKPDNSNKKLALQSLLHLDRVVKSFADGIAYRLLDYDQPFIRYMSEPVRPHDSIDFVRDDFTITIEKVKKKYLNNQQFLLINDITNVLRVGDFISINSPTHQPLIIESKRLGNEIHTIETAVETIKKDSNAQISKQMFVKVIPAQLTRNIRKIIVPKEDDLEEIQIMDIDIHMPNNFHLLNRLINKARRKGTINIKFDDYMVLEINHFRSITKNLDFTKQKIDEMKKMRKFEDEYLRITSWDLLIYDKAGKFAKNTMPISTYPISTLNTLDLLTGQIQLFAYINISEVKRLFLENNWLIFEPSIAPVKTLPDSSSKGLLFENRMPETLFFLKRGNFTLEITASEILCIFTKMAKPEYLVNRAEEVWKNHKAGEKVRFMVNNWGEFEVWK